MDDRTAASEPGTRRFTGTRKVRLGDVSPAGRLRLDALTRYTQDVSDDDTTAAGLDADPAWVVRRTEVTATTEAQLGETLDFVTFCSGLGRRWAERRLEIEGSLGARYDVVTLWICVDAQSGRPQALTDQFLGIYGPSAGDRKVNARLQHPKPPADLEVSDWSLRAVDFDVFGHVNNAAYWAVAEERIDGRPAVPFVATVEYSAGVDRGDAVAIGAVVDEAGGWVLWLLGGERTLAASISFRLPRGERHG